MTNLEIKNDIEVNNFSGSIFRSGSIIMIPITGLVPDGWALCDGSEYSKTSYENLYTAIGTVYGETNGSGGAGTSHFRVPNLHSRYSQLVPAPVGTVPAATNSNSYHSHTAGSGSANTPNQQGPNHAATNWSYSYDQAYTSHDHGGGGSGGGGGTGPYTLANRTGNVNDQVAGPGHSHYSNNSYGYSNAQNSQHNHGHAAGDLLNGTYLGHTHPASANAYSYVAPADINLTPLVYRVKYIIKV